MLRVKLLSPQPYDHVNSAAHSAMKLLTRRKDLYKALQ
jgi:hypothetical protein